MSLASSWRARGDEAARRPRRAGHGGRAATRALARDPHAVDGADVRWLANTCAESMSRRGRPCSAVRGVQHDEVGLLARRPGRPIARPAACAPPCTAASVSAVATCGCAASAPHVALARGEALAVFEQQQFLGGVDAGVAVRADAPGAAVPRARRAKSKMPSPRLASVVGHRPATAPLRAPRAGIRRRPCAWRAPGTSAHRPAHDRAARPPAAGRSRRCSRRLPASARRCGCGWARVASMRVEPGERVAQRCRAARRAASAARGRAARPARRTAGCSRSQQAQHRIGASG